MAASVRARNNQYGGGGIAAENNKGMAAGRAKESGVISHGVALSKSISAWRKSSVWRMAINVYGGEIAAKAENGDMASA
jgi:hypothetical protein